ncbi:cold-inducible protein YdjO-related protein [Priestia endophytica]|uniref:cold-inducible protein YdjO-related protein n=1 Tax=Priestia endophytica TaxID=135735 RepID=UPI00203A9E33|nr:cold-inducible protein YdjO-related protein [Priestia endophytica]MCM3538018.1 cold-shock protein [Priestia endophytica]
MHWSKRNTEEEVQEEVAVWECESTECVGWMRKNFSFDEKPSCPLCDSSMKSGERMLSKLTNMQGR